MLRSVASQVASKAFPMAQAATFAAKNKNAAAVDDKEQRNPNKPGAPKGKPVEPKAVTKEALKASPTPAEDTKNMDPEQAIERFIGMFEKAQKLAKVVDPWRPGMNIREYMRHQEKKEFTFKPPINCTPSGETLGLRVRTEDEKFMYEYPSIYPRKRFSVPDQFRFERPPDYLNEWFRKDAYFKDLVPPYKLENEELEKCIKKLKEIKDKSSSEITLVQSQLISLLPKISMQDLSTLALILSLEVPYNDMKFWQKYEETVLGKYNKFPKELFWKMRYGFGKLEFGLVSPILKKKIYERCLECVKSADSVQEIMRILHAFRGSSKRQLHNLARTVLIERKDEFMNLGPDAKSPELVANIIYYFGTTRPRYWGTKGELHRRDTIEFLTHYEEYIMDAIPKMSSSDLVKLILGIFGLKIPGFPNILHAIEKRLIMVKDQLTHHELADIIWAFGRMGDNSLCGQDKTFAALEPLFLSKAASMHHLQISRCAYTFAARRHNSEGLYKYFDKRLQEDLPKMAYDPLHNVAYYLLMREHNDDEFWKAFINRTIEVPKTLPLVYYYPFKLCRQYILHAKPEWDIHAFTEKLWWAERMKVAPVLENNFLFHEEYGNFLRVLSILNLAPTVFYTFENTFQIHYAFVDMKVGIILHLDKDMVPGTMRINESRLIPGRVLKHRGWEILDMSYRQFVEMGKQPALKFLQEWLGLASDIQVEKGVIPRVAEEVKL